MNLFGIQVTPGHVVLMFAGIIAYDAIWTWLFHNDTSDWWFERLQGLLKLGIYTGSLTLVVLLVYTPWPWNLVLAASAVTSVISVVAWLRRLQHQRAQQPQQQNPNP